MVKYYENRDMLVLRCDGCGISVDLFRGQTDRCLAHDYIHEHGWKTMKLNKKWVNICPECKKAFYEQKRQNWIERVGGGL